jgi:hypothetical protein
MQYRLPRLLLILAVTFGVAASTARAEDVSLGAPNGFIASSVDRVADRQYCVSGRTVDDTGPTQTAWVALVDADAGRLVWKTSLPFPHPYVGNYALYCAPGQDGYYVLTQEQTRLEASLNQTRVVLNKLGHDGALLMRQPVNVGFDEWAYRLDVNGNSVVVTGGTSNELDRKGKLGTYVAQFNAQLERTGLTVVPGGAFGTDTNAAINGAILRIAGHFIPDTEGTSGGHEAFAVSQVDLGKRKYLSSTYISPPDERAQASAFGADGTVYYVATTPAELLVAVVSPTGKLVQHFSTNKIFCDLTSIGVDGATIHIIGTTCEKPRVSALAMIDLKSQRATLIRRLAGDINVARFDGETWVGVVDTTDHGVVLRRDAM